MLSCRTRANEDHEVTNDGQDIAENRHFPPYEGLLRRLQPRRAEMARRVAEDVGRPDDAPELVDLVTAFLERLLRGERLSEAERLRLRAEGAAAARAGEPIERPIDRYLTAGWVTWEAAIEAATPDEQAALTALGGALLRAGDDTAAALADGYASAERALAAQTGALRRAVLDELLTQPAASGSASGRLARRTALVGLDPAAPVRVALVRSAAEIEDEGPVVTSVIAALQGGPRRRSVLAAVRAGDLVIVLQGRAPGDGLVTDGPLTDGLRAIGPDPWWAVVGEPVGIGDLPGAYADAVDAIRVVVAARSMRTVVAVADVALERAISADPELSRAAVARWLGPLESSPRTGPELVETLEAWFDAGESITGAARRLHLAARTVSYRLERIARLLGRSELDGEVRLRLATALLLRRLVATPARPVGDATRVASG
jgi:hypothetical protein